MLLVVAVVTGLGVAVALQDIAVELSSAARYESAASCGSSPSEGCRSELPATLVFRRAASGTATLRLRFIDSERTAYLFDDNGLVQRIPRAGRMLIIVRRNGRRASVNTFMLPRTARAILAEALARGALRAYGGGILERWRVGRD